MFLHNCWNAGIRLRVLPKCKCKWTIVFLVNWETYFRTSTQESIWIFKLRHTTISYTNVHVHRRACVRKRAWTCVHNDMWVYKSMCVYAGRYVCVNTCLCAQLCVWVCLSVWVGVRVSVKSLSLDSFSLTSCMLRYFHMYARRRLISRKLPCFSYR